MGFMNRKRSWMMSEKISGAKEVPDGEMSKGARKVSRSSCELRRRSANAPTQLAAACVLLPAGCSHALLSALEKEGPNCGEIDQTIAESLRVSLLPKQANGVPAAAAEGHASGLLDLFARWVRTAHP